MQNHAICSAQSKIISSTVNGAERSVSVAIRDGALAIASVMDAGIVIGLAAEVTHSATANLLGGINQMMEGRSRLLEAHRELAVIGRKLGLTVTDWGDGSAKNADLRPAPQLSVAA